MEPMGFRAKAPLSGGSQQIGANYPGIFKALTKAALAAATANAPGAVSAAIDGLFAFKVEMKESSAEELAWLLLRRSLARAMAELTVEVLQSQNRHSDNADQLVAELDEALAARDIWIDESFFERPSHHPVVDFVAQAFRRWIASFGLTDTECNSIQYRFSAYFTFALRLEWAEHSDAYAKIDLEARNWATPFGQANKQERAWIRNAAYLQRLIREPVFDERFGIERIFVPLRAWCLDVRNTEYQTATESYSASIETEQRVVVDLEDRLTRWFKRGDTKDAIRAICGGPGSGKSSFAKIWAAKLAGDGVRVLLVPMHRLVLRSEYPDIRAILWEFLRDKDVLPSDPLDQRTGESQLLIIFDGLDELKMQGRAGRELARNFVDEVDKRIDNWNDREDRLVQVLFAGRNIAVDATRLTGKEVLHILPYHHTSDEDYEKHLGHGFGSLSDPDDLLVDDRYSSKRWWKRFGEAIGENYDDIPIHGHSSQLRDITVQPLLNYLVALSFRRGKLDFSSSININLVYKDLLDAVYERRWSHSKHPARRQLSLPDFYKLLEELGLAAWQGAGRTIAECKIEQACKNAGLIDQLALFRDGARAGAISLLAAFYFRQVGGIEGERTFEFTHKSFGEYLAARRIIRWIEDIHEERRRNSDDRQRGWTTEDALIKWSEITGPSAMDFHMLHFCNREVDLRKRKCIEKWHHTMIELFNDQLKYGLPIHRLDLKNFKEMARASRNAEETLFAAVRITTLRPIKNTESETSTYASIPFVDLDLAGFQVMLLRLAVGQENPIVFWCSRGVQTRDGRAQGYTTCKFSGDKINLMLLEINADIRNLRTYDILHPFYEDFCKRFIHGSWEYLHGMYELNSGQE